MREMHFICIPCYDAGAEIEEQVSEVEAQTAHCQGWLDAANKVGYLNNPFGFQGGTRSVAWMEGYCEHDNAIKQG